MQWSLSSDDGDAIRGARREFVKALGMCRDIDGDDAAIIFGELVGNAARHAPGPIRICLLCGRQRVELLVDDMGPGFSVNGHLPPEPLSENGRGLFIVHALGATVSVEAFDGWTRVRAELPRKGDSASVR